MTGRALTITRLWNGSDMEDGEDRVGEECEWTRSGGCEAVFKDALACYDELPKVEPLPWKTPHDGDGSDGMKADIGDATIYIDADNESSWDCCVCVGNRWIRVEGRASMAEAVRAALRAVRDRYWDALGACSRGWVRLYVGEPTAETRAKHAAAMSNGPPWQAIDRVAVKP